MGAPRGKRNAARQKVWPGADAAQLREIKRNAGIKLELSLKQQANMILYGYPNVIEPGDEKEVWSVLGGGAPVKTVEIYKAPKKSERGKENNSCSGCGKPRSYGSAGKCRECYRAAALSAFHERSPFIEIALDRQTNLSVEDSWAADGITQTGGRLSGFENKYVLISYIKDFADDLIEEIYEKELADGRPLFAIAPQEDRPPKMLFFSKEHRMQLKARVK